MWNYIICNRKPTDEPYHIASVHLNIYTLEELCYFLSENMVLADDVINDGNLSDWLFNKAGLKDEKEYLRFDENKVTARLIWVFAKSHYFTDAQLRTLNANAEKLERLTGIEKKKLKADTLIKYGKYSHALACYNEILEEGGEDAFIADVLYNAALACEYMFLSSQAVDYFKTAYDKNSSVDFLKAYLSAVYFKGGLTLFEKEAQALNADTKAVSEILNQIDEIHPKEMPKDKDAALNEWIRQYHLSVDQ